MNCSKNELLQYIAKSNNISIDDVLNDINDMKRQELLNQHPYKIFFSESDQRWHSYLPDISKKSGRKPIAKKDRTNLENKIVDYYLTQQKPKTLQDLYPLWSKYKAVETSLANVRKLNWAWDRYYKDEDIVTKPISDLSVLDIKEWMLFKIEEFELTNRQYKEMKALLNMLLDYAIEKGIITVNSSRNVRNISYKKFKQTKDKPVTKQIYVENEEDLVITTALAQYQKTHNTAYLAICLNFTAALRVGELVALKVSDFDSEELHIQRQEVPTFIEVDGKVEISGYTVVPHTKSICSDRYIPLTTNSFRFLEMIQKENRRRGFSSDYLLLDENGDRLHHYAIQNALKRVNKNVNLTHRSNHNIRKTCLSQLNSSNLLTDEEIRTFAGHKEISTTQNSYFFMTSTPSDRKLAFETAISNNINV